MQSVHTGNYLQFEGSRDDVNVRGEQNDQSLFKVHIVTAPNKIRLESTKYTGQFICVQSNGKVSTSTGTDDHSVLTFYCNSTNDTKNENTDNANSASDSNLSQQNDTKTKDDDGRDDDSRDIDAMDGNDKKEEEEDDEDKPIIISQLLFECILEYDVDSFNGILQKYIQVNESKGGTMEDIKNIMIKHMKLNYKVVQQQVE